MVPELLVLIGWVAIATGGCLVVWRVAYAQGVADARSKSCCSGGEEHDHPQLTMPSPDELDDEIERILAGGH